MFIIRIFAVKSNLLPLFCRQAAAFFDKFKQNSRSVDTISLTIPLFVVYYI